MTSGRLEYLFIHFYMFYLRFSGSWRYQVVGWSCDIVSLPPLERVHVWAVEAVAPVLPSLLFLGFRAAFLVLLLAGALVVLPPGALVVLPLPAVLPAGALVVFLPAVLMVLSVAALLPEDFLAVPEAEAVAGLPLLVEGPV